MIRTQGLVATLCLVTALTAQQQNNAGHGGIYRQLDLAAMTGNQAHLGVVDIGGKLFISARDPALGGNHVIYRITPDNLASSFAQPAVHAGSAWGMRDLCTDGQNIAGGSEAGITILDPTGGLASSWAGQPIQQPIAGAALAALGLPRGLAWDGTANGGNGAFFAVNFDSPIYEFDRAGAILGSWPNLGWSGSGLAIDPITGNLWISAGPGGGIAEIKRSTGTLTGRSIPQNYAGAGPGGLSEACTAAGIHAPWANQFNLVSIAQGEPDLLTVHRVHFLAGKPGWDEVRLEIGVNGGPFTPGPLVYGELDQLDLQVVDPTGALTGTPCWTILNLMPESLRDALTDLTPFVPGLALLEEHRTINPANVGVPSNAYLRVPHVIGAVDHMPLPPGFLVAAGDTVRLQTVYMEPLNPRIFASTNEAWFVGGHPATGILVEAVGPSSFKQDPTRGFWRVQHLGGVAAIYSITFDWNTSTRAGQEAAVFDVAQERMNDRHEGGNASAAGCHGTYRSGSDLTAGLNYHHQGNHRAPCAVGSENSGFTIDAGTPDAARALTYRFVGGAFVGGVAFEFDCDTDGGLGVSGAAMAGLVVYVKLVGGQQLVGTLAADPSSRFRAFVNL